MSVRVSSLCWRLSLPVVEKLVLLRLADYADHKGSSIYPAVGTVASDCGISDRAVQYILRKFTADGILLLLGNENGGRGKTRRYALDLERLLELSGTREVQETADFAEIHGVSEVRVQTVQTVQSVQNLCTLSDDSDTVQTVKRVQDSDEKGEVDLHPTRHIPVNDINEDKTPKPPLGLNGDLFSNGMDIPAKTEKPGKTRRKRRSILETEKAKRDPRTPHFYKICNEILPRRRGGSNAERAYIAFLETTDEGVSIERLYEGAAAYKAECIAKHFCDVDGNAISEYVMATQTFFGINDKKWEEYIKIAEDRKNGKNNVVAFNNKPFQPQRERKAGLAG